MSYAILRTAKLKTIGNIAGSLHHTFRSIDTPNADPSLTHLNVNTYQNTEIALNAIKEKIPDKHRKDAVLCIEYLVTGSPDWDGWNNEKKDDYFRNATKWLEDKHGKENVIMTSVQLDESTPHMVAYVVPLDEKGKLNAKKFLGGREKLRNMQTDFAQKVGEPVGLVRGIEGSKAEHQTIKNYYAKVNDTEKFPSVEIDVPKKGLMESHEKYEQRFIDNLSEQITPILSHNAAMQNEIKEIRQELKQTKQHLNKVLKHTQPYVLATNKLTPELVPELNRIIETQSTILHDRHWAKVNFEYNQRQQKERLEQERERERSQRAQEELRMTKAIMSIPCPPDPPKPDNAPKPAPVTVEHLGIKPEPKPEPPAPPAPARRFKP